MEKHLEIVQQVGRNARILCPFMNVVLRKIQLVSFFLTVFLSSILILMDIVYPVSVGCIESVPTPKTLSSGVAASSNVALSNQTITIPMTLPSGAKPLEMVLIPAGSFMMGANVTITKPFYMGKYEVTQAQWQAIMGNNPASYQGDINKPVESVSWDTCQKFIQKLNGLGQGTFRIPTEAEWEYACRAGTTTRFYWGDDTSETLIKQYAWYRGNNSPDKTKPVGLLLPNAWGLYDMSGNVHEWCSDWFANLPTEPQIDPQGPASGDKKVIKGGHWGNVASGCQSSLRLAETVDQHYYLGLRILKETINASPASTPTYTSTSTPSARPISTPAVNINTSENFPDPNFRKYIEGYMGIASGGVFSENDALKATNTINCENKKISSIKGIEFFKNIKELDINNNPLSNIDLSHNLNLEILRCYNCQLKKLDVSMLSKLKILQCPSNNIDRLDISKNTNLYLLDAGWNNNFTSVDLSASLNLTELYLYSAKLTNLDITNNRKLIRLSVSGNFLTSIDISNKPNLKYLQCDSNNITEIIGIDKANLSGLDIRNNYIDVSQSWISRFQNLGKIEFVNGASDINITKGFAYLPQKFSKDINQGLFTKQVDWSTGFAYTLTKIPGSCSYTDGTYSVKGNGDDIWNSDDEGFYVYTEKSGSWSLSGKVKWIDPGTNVWAKAGIMIREKGEKSNSVHYWTMLKGSKDLSGPHWRIAEGGVSEWKENRTINNKPIPGTDGLWLRVTRLAEYDQVFIGMVYRWRQLEYRPYDVSSDADECIVWVSNNQSRGK